MWCSNDDKQAVLPENTQLVRNEASRRGINRCFTANIRAGTRTAYNQLSINCWQCMTAEGLDAHAETQQKLSSNHRYNMAGHHKTRSRPPYLRLSFRFLWSCLLSFWGRDKNLDVTLRVTLSVRFSFTVGGGHDSHEESGCLSLWAAGFQFN